MTRPKQVSASRKILAALGLLAALGVGTYLGFLSTSGLGLQDSGPPPPSPFQDRGTAGRALLFTIVLAWLSVVVLLAGVAAYVLVLTTRLFIFDLRRPVWSNFKTRLFIANILVPMPIMLGISGLVAALGSPLLIGLGMSPETAFLLLFFVPFVLMQLFSTWLSIWTPLVTRLARSRLLALGVEPTRIDEGIFLGISDPAKKSLKKLGLIEDDVGMLWITPDELIYQGDNDAFRVRRDQCVSIERIADAGSVSAYFGNVHIILTFARVGAAPRRVRLHPESTLTMTGTARASDRLANDLEQWTGAVTLAETKD
jgi:hypothetical protein